MEQRILKFINDNNLIENKPVVCAVSGGVDSICLLHILNKLGYKVVLAHVNHHKRKESEIEEQAMRNLANTLNIPFELLNYHYNGEDNFHNDSHNARYSFFRELCDKYNTNIIATAHHLDDQMETILIKLMEGSNLYGYGGISICNDDGKYKIVRPLLCVNKEQLYTYANKNSLKYFEDCSNFEDDFLRNRLRHHIVPLLKEECSDLYSKISQFSIQAKEAFHYIRKQSIDYLKLTNNNIDLDNFNSFDIAIKKDIISLLLEKYKIRKNFDLINDILGLLSSTYGTKSIKLEKEYYFIRVYDKAFIKKQNFYNLTTYLVGLEDTIIFNNKYKFYFSKKIPLNNAKYIKLCYNSLELPFKVRSKKNGDFIELPFGSKKVSRVFIDNKIPKEERDLTPIVLNSNDEVVWIYDMAKSTKVYHQKNIGDIFFVCEEV